MSKWVWGGLIALSLCAIVAGFLGGSTTAHPPPVAALHRRPHPRRPATSKVEYRIGEQDRTTRDLFSRDDVVVQRPQMVREHWQPERLEIVIGLCGQSVAVEGGFLELGIPLTFDLDPHAAQADEFAKLIHRANDPLYVHLERAPTTATLATLRRRFGQIDGIASRESRGMPAALAGSGLAFLDERGTDGAAAFAAHGVPLGQRDETADDRAQRTYIEYMLTRAAVRSGYERRVVVLLRPTPSSLAALAEFLHAHHPEFEPLRPKA